MYASHWGLNQSPFGQALDARFFFESPGHEEALARLHFLVEERRRLGLLLGPSGCGKTLLLEIFAQRVRDWGRPVAKMSLLGTEPGDLIAAIADQWHVRLADRAPLWRIWQQLEGRLREFRFQQLETVVLLDDADQASPEVLTQVARLVKCETVADIRLTVVLSGQAERTACLGNVLLELAELRIDIPSWDPSDTEAFLNRSMERAGGTLWVFAEEAVRRMHELGQGSPRKIRQLADLALVAGAGGNLERIDADTVEAAGRQLGMLAL